MITIRPSIASASPLNLERELDRLGKFRKNVHLDIEDGSYIESITFGMKTARAIAQAVGSPCDVHITANDPLKLIGQAQGMEADALCFHLELLSHPLEGLSRIKAQGMRAGLALSFRTPLECLEMFLGELDYLLLMTAEPDGRGETFHPASLKRVARARQLLPPEASIFVDGGIGWEEFPALLDSGADTVILGRSVWKTPDPEETIAKYYALAQSRGFSCPC